MNFFIFFKSKITISFLLFIVCASNGLAQETDVVYLAGEKVVKCTLLDITSKKVKYRDKAGKIISTDTDDAIMVFNKVGDFIIFPKKDIDPFLSSQFIRSTKLPQADFFITLEKKLIVAKLISKNENSITYENIENPKGEQNVNLDLIAMIIFRDGHHELMVTPSQSSGVLNSVASLIKLYNDNNYTPEPSQQTKPKDNVATSNNVAETKKDSPQKNKEDKEKVDNAKIEKEKVNKEKAEKEKAEKENNLRAKEEKENADKIKAAKDKVEKATAKANEEKNNKKDPKKDEKITETSVVSNEVNSKSPVIEAQLKLDSSGLLSHTGYVYLNSVVKEKVTSLNSLLATIANKNTDEATANQAINQACSMFSTENARIEVVTNEGSDYKVRFKVRDYLVRVKTIKEENAHVSWANVNYVGKIQKEVDGSFKGIVIDKQKIIGLNSENINTTKLDNLNTEVIFKNSYKIISGNSKDLYDVLFSDIGILVTK